MKRLFQLIILTVGTVFTVYSQAPEKAAEDTWINLLHLEGGAVFLNGSINEDLDIRQDINRFYHTPVSHGHISSFTSGHTFGIRWEYFHQKYRAGISTGLRVKSYNTEITGSTSSGTDFFYIRYSEIDSDTKFARLKSITENRSLLTVPVEVRFFPLQVPFFGLYLKAGCDFSLTNLKHSTDVSFHNEDMKTEKNAVKKSFHRETDDLYATAYAALGFKFGKPDKINYMFEIFLPSLYLTNNNFVLTDAEYYSGLRFSLQYPFN